MYHNTDDKRIKHEDIEKEVFQLIEQYNGKNIFTFRRYKLMRATDLNNDFRIDPLDAYALLERFAEKFGIEPSEINFGHYFPDNRAPDEPLTIQLLIEGDGSLNIIQVETLLCFLMCYGLIHDPKIR